MSLSENIKSRRCELGMSQRDFAEKVGITQSMICQIERGTKLPSLPLGCQIADVLGCTVDELLGKDAEKQAQ